LSVIVTLVALPPKVFPLTVTGVTPQVLPEEADRVTIGALVQPQLMEKVVPVAVHPEALRTVIVWLPFATSVKMAPVWKAPASSWYWYPAPVGLVTVTTAWLKPPVQSTVCTGTDGTGRGALMTTGAVAAETQPALLVTVKVYVPDGMPGRVAVIPVPVLTSPSGNLVSVHIPVEGNPLNPTLPVDTAQVG